MVDYLPGGKIMERSWIGFDNIPYKTEKEKLEADLKYIAKLEKEGRRPFIGMDGKIYFDEQKFLEANKTYLEENKGLSR